MPTPKQLQDSLDDRLLAMLHQALGYTDIELLSDLSERQDRFLAFVLGAICNSQIAPADRVEEISCACRLLFAVFAWPESDSTEVVAEMFDEIDSGLFGLEFEGGSQSIKDFECSIMRLNEVLTGVWSGRDPRLKPTARDRR